MKDLSKYFTLDEMVSSQTAVRYNIKNVPPAAQEVNLARLCSKTLDKVREFVDTPIIVSSGYRCPTLNRIVGGAPNSDHMDGRAADINAKGMTPKILALAIIKSGVEFDQLILEGGAWVHISIPKEGVPARKQVLTATFTNGKAHYSAGI